MMNEHIKCLLCGDSHNLPPSAGLEMVMECMLLEKMPEAHVFNYRLQTDRSSSSSSENHTLIAWLDFSPCPPC
jgi:hypothetical protein